MVGKGAFVLGSLSSGEIPQAPCSLSIKLAGEAVEMENLKKERERKKTNPQ